MTRVLVRPHFQTGAVECGAVRVLVDGRYVPTGQAVEGWDYSCPVTIEADAEVDVDLVRSECGLGPDSAVALVLTWWATSTNVRRSTTSPEVTVSGTYVLTAHVDPGVAGGSIVVMRSLALLRPGVRKSDLAPSQRGAVLWEEPKQGRARIDLEGSGSRFPTELSEFGAGGPAEPGAVWYLDADLTDLDVSPLSTLRLHLNSGHPVVKRLGTNPDDPETMALRSTIDWDVTRRLVHDALDSDDFHEGWGLFRPDSLGDVLESLVRRLWPGSDPGALRAQRAYDRGSFEARIQARSGLMAERR